MEKQKFVRLKEYNQVIIFPCIIEHSSFRNFNVVSAGFCYINPTSNVVSCFGESVSLRMKSQAEDDSFHATKQIFGVEAALELKIKS